MSPKQKSELFFDESLADKEVIKILIRELNRKHTMSNLVQDVDGNLLAVHQFEEITVERAKELAEKLEHELGMLKSFIENKASEVDSADPGTPENPAAPADNPAANPEQPTDTTSQPAADPNAAAPADGATPSTDPAAASSTDQAATDVNAATPPAPLS